MSNITITKGGQVDIPIASKPDAILFAIGVHGPSRRERFFNNVWCLHLYPYEAMLRINGVEFPIHPGCAGILPPGAETVYTFPQRSMHACCHFVFNESVADTAASPIPIMQDLGPRFADTYRQLEEAIACFPSNPLQAEVRLWDILWQLARPAEPTHIAPRVTHPAAHRAAELIELNIANPLSVRQLAGKVHISQNQLCRLFQAAYGQTPIAYIQRRRAHLAEQLLRHSQLPIATVAEQVGIGDTSQFNKLMHKMHGMSPSEIRRAARKM